MRSFFLILVLFCIGPSVVSGQGSGMSDLESRIISVLTMDSTSTVVSYMPVGRTFGIQGLSDKDQLVIVKIGKQVKLVSQMTGFVFGPSSPSGPLVRLDSNKVFGLEYHVDPFARKDSLFMIATSSFLRGKGFLAYFDEGAHDWKAYRGNDEVMKESSRPFYDPVGDHLYMVCQEVRDRNVDTTTTGMDNVMRYSFTTGKWDRIGRMDAEVYHSAISIPVRLSWTAAFGAGNLEQGDLNILQPDRNRWMSTDSVFRSRISRDVPAMADGSRVLQLILMGDGLYVFSGRPDSVGVDRIALRESDFTVRGGKVLYDMTTPPVRQDRALTLNKWGFGLIGVVVFAEALWWYRRRAAGRIPQGAGIGETVMRTGQENAEVQYGRAKLPIHYFLDSLTPVEKGLVLELADFAERGAMMDTRSLNQILGVSHKEPEVQKVRRSLTITRINSNFAQVVVRDGILIAREKDPSDRRVFMYFITPEHASLILSARQA